MSSTRCCERCSDLWRRKRSNFRTCTPIPPHKRDNSRKYLSSFSSHIQRALLPRRAFLPVCHTLLHRVSVRAEPLTRDAQETLLHMHLIFTADKIRRPACPSEVTSSSFISTTWAILPIATSTSHAGVYQVYVSCLFHLHYCPRRQMTHPCNGRPIGAWIVYFSYRR